MAKIDTVEISRERSLFDDKVQMITAFLNKHYEIKVPIQDPSKMQILCKDKNRYQFPPTFDDISLHLLSEGLSVSDNMLRKILRSPNQIAPVNPIEDYFCEIRGKWKGKSQIDLLCEHIFPRCFDDKPEKFYRERTDKFIRKWLVACVACWVGNVPNDVAFGLVQAAGGSGKTFLARFLLPQQLKEFYIMSSKDERKFDMEDAYTRYMLINFEELNGINKGSINTFKAMQSERDIVTKMRHEEFPTKKKRIGCAVFSTNFNQENGGFIHPHYGSDTRRFGIVEITDIDRSYSKKVDVDQMWAEALALYESNSFDYRFSHPDYADFNLYNERYKFETDAMRYLQIYIGVPEEGEKGEYLQPTQILQRLVQQRRIKSEDMRSMTPQKIGIALGALGYEQTTYRSQQHNNEPRRGYYIKFLN